MNVIESLKHNSYLKSLKREQLKKEIGQYERYRKSIDYCKKVMDDYKSSLIKDWMLEELSWM